MKNKLYYIFLGLLISFSFMDSVFAADISATLVVDNTGVLKGEIASVKLNLKSDVGINTCLVKLTYDDVLELSDIKGANDWTVEESNAGTFIVKFNSSTKDDNTLSNGKNISQLDFKVNGDGKINVSIDHCASAEKEEKYSEITGGSVSLTAKELSDDTTLKSIEVTGGTFEGEGFTPNGSNFVVNLEQTNFSLKMFATNPEYDDDIVVKNEAGDKLDPNSLTFDSSSGDMVLFISVNGKDMYNLLIKYENKTFDNSLSSLKINGKDVNLVSGQYEYDFEIDGNITELKVEAVLKDSQNFKFDEGDGNYIYNANSTSFALIIEPVDSKSGAKGVTYTINIKKKGGSSNPPPVSSSPKPSSTTPNVPVNPGTGDGSMFIMIIILLASFGGSVFLYQKNVENE